MLNGSSLTILILGILSSLGIVCLQIYALAIDYPLNIFTDSAIQLNWSGILSAIEAGVGSAVLLLCTVTAIPYLGVVNIKNTTPIKFATIYYAIMALTSGIISVYRLSETGIIFYNGLCKRLDGDVGLVCPTVMFRSEMTIETKEDCVFNAFADSPSVWNKTGEPKIDWSDKEMYDKKSQQTVFDAYKAARTDVDIDMEEMTLYHDCWYWGCDEICNDRHTINIVMAYASAGVSVIYIVLVIMSGIQSRFDYKEVPDEEPLSPVDIPISVPVKTVEPPSIPPGDPIPDTDQGSSSDNKGSPSSDNIRSWNFNLRM